MRKRRCIAKRSDPGVFKCTAADLSHDGSMLALGDASGVVNMHILKGKEFDENAILAKSIENITTKVGTLSFGKKNELLAVGSKWKKNAFRLVHLPSFKAFSNFPGLKNNMKYPFCAAFSSDNSLLSVGNDEGHCYLYRLPYYE